MPATLNVINATPTLRLDGQENERLRSLLTGMVMTEQAGALSSLELRVNNAAGLTSGSAEYAFDAGGDLALGKEIIVGAGDSDAPVEIFRGLVSGLEGIFEADGTPELIILGEDFLQKARLARRTKIYENMSLEDIAREIANTHGLTPRITDLNFNFGTQVQMNETDLGFLRRLLLRADADVQLVGREMHVSVRSAVRRGEVELELGDALRSVRVLADLAHQVNEATVKGFEISSGSELQGDGQETALGPGAGRKGAEELARGFSARRQHGGQFFVSNQAEADALASAIRNGRSRRFLRAKGVAAGNPAVRVGTHIRLTSIGDWFSNTFYVVKVRHIFDLREGYRTEFEAECAFLGGRG